MQILGNTRKHSYPVGMGPGAIATFHRVLLTLYALNYMAYLIFDCAIADFSLLTISTFFVRFIALRSKHIKLAKCF